MRIFASCYIYRNREIKYAKMLLKYVRCLELFKLFKLRQFASSYPFLEIWLFHQSVHTLVYTGQMSTCQSFKNICWISHMVVQNYWVSHYTSNSSLEQQHEFACVTIYAKGGRGSNELSTGSSSLCIFFFFSLLKINNKSEMNVLQLSPHLTLKFVFL